MIVSHQYRFIFFAVPRTGTHSVRQALRRHLGEGDWEQQMLTGRSVLPVPQIAALGHGHVSVRQAREWLPASVWRDYYKFAFVREPFDRFVSVCCFLHRGVAGFAGQERQFMQAALARPRFRRRVLAAPQWELLADQEGRLGVDFLGRYERLEADLRRIAAELALPPLSLPHANASRRRSSTGYYDATLKAAVADFYRQDFQQLGYRPHLPRPGEATACS